MITPIYINISDAVRVKFEIDEDIKCINFCTHELHKDNEDYWADDYCSKGRIALQDVNGFVMVINRLEKLLILK